jgi:multidrug efflux pump subunit AcrB
LRRVGEELVDKLASVPNVSRVAIVGGEPRIVRVELSAEGMQGYQISPLEISQALSASNVTLPAGDFRNGNESVVVETGLGLVSSRELANLVVGVANGQPIFLKDVATIRDTGEEVTSYTRHGWGPARHRVEHAMSAGSIVTAEEMHHEHESGEEASVGPSDQAVVLAISKQKGSNAVRVAKDIVSKAAQLREQVLPSDVEMVVTRNYGINANEKVNELVEALGVAILIVVALLTLSMGWREAFVVALAVPIVFGLTLAVNLAFGYTVNRVTLFALILSLGLLVDDPIVDVENIARHFHLKGRASLQIVMDAVAEIRPPLISATLAVIVSFLPMFFITGMMGPYMSPMALNVPVAMLMSMVVAFTITPWLTYHMLKGKFQGGHATTDSSHSELYDPAELQKSLLYRLFKPLMMPLMKSKTHAVVFLLIIGGLTVAAALMAMFRLVPLKMLPFDNKNEVLVLVDLDEGTSLEQSDALVRELEEAIAQIAEVTDYSSYVGTPGPIDFNGMVRHYYLRSGDHFGEIRLNLVGKKERHLQSHGIALRERKRLEEIASRHGALLRIVELPPGPPVLSSVVAEVYGSPGMEYNELMDSAQAVAQRLKQEPGIFEVDDNRQANQTKWTFVVDKEKAALSGISTEDISKTIAVAVGGDTSQSLRVDSERNPLAIKLQLPRADRSDLQQIGLIRVKGRNGALVPIIELGQWKKSFVNQTIYHKNLLPVVYVTAETVGRPPAECVLDVLADRSNLSALKGREQIAVVGNGLVENKTARPVAGRTYFTNGSGIAWAVPNDVQVAFAGEGEWKITIDVFRDLGLAFGAAMLMIYVILVGQTGSFLVPIVVMMAIPLTVLGVMPGFWMLNQISGQVIEGYADPVYFTATAMIGMIALSGIVTRDSIILVDFIDQTVGKGRTLIEAILESRVVRLRPILLTAGAALLSSIPITLDPIFSGLGWSLIFGLIASTIFTLFVIPISYWLLKEFS